MSLSGLIQYDEVNNAYISYRDATVVIVSGGLTSVFAGFVVFSVIGFMACDAGVPIDKAINAGKL